MPAALPQTTDSLIDEIVIRKPEAPQRGANRVPPDDRLFSMLSPRRDRIVSAPTCVMSTTTLCWQRFASPDPHNVPDGTYRKMVHVINEEASLNSS